MQPQMITTSFELPGYRIVRNVGVVRGITVRSRGLGGQIMAGLRTIAGGKIDEYIELCEHARKEGFDLMVEEADQLGANAIIGVRYDATEMMENMSEVLAYGTAVVVEPD
jgi:uncharacterized protein YbjQ (UPF0145 family)